MSVPEYNESMLEFLPEIIIEIYFVLRLIFLLRDVFAGTKEVNEALDIFSIMYVPYIYCSFSWP